MVIESLNLKHGQITRFSSHVILERCRLLNVEERQLYHIQMVTSRFPIVIMLFDFTINPFALVCFTCLCKECIE